MIWNDGWVVVGLLQNYDLKQVSVLKHQKKFKVERFSTNHQHLQERALLRGEEKQTRWEQHHAVGEALKSSGTRKLIRGWMVLNPRLQETGWRFTF